MGRTVVCYTHITPRLVGRLEALAARVNELEVLEIATSEAAYPWWDGDHAPKGVVKRRLFDRSLESIGNAEAVSALRDYLEKCRPAVVVVADYSRGYMRFICRWTRGQGGAAILPAVTWSGDYRRNLVRELAKGFVLRGLFNAVCVSGERSYAYFNGLGFGRHQLWKAHNCIDNDHFASGAEKARANAPSLRVELGLPERYFIYVGSLEAKKNLGGLLDGYALYRQRGGVWGLVIVGGGPQLESLARRVGREDIPGVRFVGTRGHRETPLYYGLAECLVTPSLSEPWGLVVNEGAAAGLAILASNKCGCVPELVHRGINGYVFDPENRAELALLMEMVARDDLALKRMQVSSKELVRYYTPDRWADAMADCIKQMAHKGALAHRTGRDQAPTVF